MGRETGRSRAKAAPAFRPGPLGSTRPGRLAGPSLEARADRLRWWAMKTVVPVSLALLVLAGCGSGPIYLQGRLVDAIDGGPLAGATVSVYYLTPSHYPEAAQVENHLKHGKTDRGGVFAFWYRHVFGPEHRIRMTCDGYGPVVLSEEEMNVVEDGVAVGWYNRHTMKVIRLKPGVRAR